MSEEETFLSALFGSRNISVGKEQKAEFSRFCNEPANKASIQLIIQQQNELMAKWKLEERIREIIQQPVRILNATTGKPYETKFDFNQWGWTDIALYEWDGLEETGLHFDERTNQITGVPTGSGDKNVVFKFKLADQSADAPFNEKPLKLIINPDPKSLWKNLESNPDDPHWKEDNVTVFAPLGDRHVVASSKRGRAHANVGSFREDDFAFSDLPNRWSIVVVSDGAGSAPLSRKGSQLACQGIVDFFHEEASVASMSGFDELLKQHTGGGGEDTGRKLNRFVYDNLGKAVFRVHKQLEEFARTKGCSLKDLNNTLVFTLFRKFEKGYVLLSFGVGDCPMAVLNKDVSGVINLNWIDVGEFGGGTRFITMPEIFSNEKFATRFGFKIVEDFSYLVLMSDGIYDPKFVVESNLPDIKKWKEFFRDLDGENEDKIKVELRKDNDAITTQLDQWMDFWSIGNHDDRTLAIVF